MPRYSTKSRKKLETCHPDIKRLFNEVIKHYDCTILEGKRSNERQYELFSQGKSKLDGVNKKSKHQVTRKEPLSKAVDVAPCPIDWSDKIKFYHFVGYVKATANQLNIKIRYGADWDNDNDLKDQTFFDLPHFELMEK